MLTSSYLKGSLGALREFEAPDSQILAGNGYDGVIDILQNMRGIVYPCAILESGSSGAVQLIEGPVDTYTQSVWVMGQLGRGEDESALYAQMKELSRKVAAKLLADARASIDDVAAIDWSRFSYMQRYGGPNARGYELVFTFKENFSLLLSADDLK